MVDQNTKVSDQKSDSKNVSAEKLKALEVALAGIDKRFGNASAFMMSKAPKVEVSVISTGSILLDNALGAGGLPRGRIVEIYGPEASGKTTLCYHIIAEAQKKGGIVAFIDAEHSVDIERARDIGVDVDKLVLSQPNNGEEALEIAETLVRSNAVDVIIVDSVAALTPKAEIDGDMGDAQMGLHARLMSQAMRKLTAIVSKSNTLIVFTNQIRMKIGVMFGNPETTTGGQALKFYSSVRLEIRKKNTIKKGEEPIGITSTVKVVKNKVGAPFKSVDIDIMNKGGINKKAEILNFATENGIIKVSGSWFSMGEEKLGQGRETVLEKFETEPEFYKKIEKMVMDAIGKK
ncbi:MAG: recombinase RecA [Patescibacteria group bacterium]